MNSWMLSLVFVLPALVQGTKPSDSRLSDPEIKELGGLVMKYFRAKEQGKGEEEGKALTKFGDAVEALQKKKKGDALLKSVKDWERILDLSDDYSKDALTPGTEGIREISLEDGGGKLRFFISVPKSYDKKVAAPLLLAIPENGKDNPKEQFAKYWNSPAIKDFFVVLVPQMPEDTKTWTEPEGFGKALSPFGKIIRQVHIDCNRLFIAGVGPGAKCAAVLASNFPSRWAGAIFRGDIGFVFAESFFNLPVYASGDADSIKTLATKLQELGGNFSQGEDDPARIGAWAADKIRNAYPTTVMLRPANPRARSAYWVQLEQWETTEGTPVEQQLASLKATIDREKNQIDVTTNAVKSFVIFFNDAMLDLDKPVRVVTNGKEWVGTIPRSLQYFIDLAYKRNDNRLVYVRHQYFDAPPPVADANK